LFRGTKCQTQPVRKILTKTKRKLFGVLSRSVTPKFSHGDYTYTFGGRVGVVMDRIMNFPMTSSLMMPKRWEVQKYPWNTQRNAIRNKSPDFAHIVNVHSGESMV
jgi:hypothetical protein